MKTSAIGSLIESYVTAHDQSFDYDLGVSCIKLYIIQIMNGYEFNSANIFMSWKINILFNEASAELNRINVNLSTNENIRTIERMKNIHYLFYTTSKKI